MNTQAPLLFGKYRLLELIARGGMAEVFKAKSHGVDGFEKLVVIKRILPDLAQNQTFVEMCINEAKLSVALSHANIVQVFDLGREEDTYFIVMEYVNGMDFAEVLRRCRRATIQPPIELCVYVAGETARALDYAHRRKDAQMRPLRIVHRDVSPQNVLLSFEGEVKVTDFGIAKARTTVEESGTIKGKYAYMSPEQAKGEDVDARADIYALGVVLYESLVGRNPFQEATPYQTLRRVQAGEKPPVLLARPDLPDELARIVEKALEPDREQRYASAARFYEDLAGYLYTTGKRVAAHDLAEWMATLRESGARDDEAHRVRDALEDIEPSLIKTPVEVPASASQLSRPGPSTSSGLSRPQFERRDVTLVSIELPPEFADGSKSMEPLLAVASRYGGVLIDSTEHYAVLAFGVQDPDGRDTETALRCALKLQSATKRFAPQSDVGFGIHAARVHVHANGEVERDQWFTGALATARDLGRAAGARVLAHESVARLVGEQFTLSPVRGRATSPAQHGTPLQVLNERGTHDGGHRRFIGRREAFKRAGEIFAWASKRGLRSLSVLGEAGTGKTRFLDEVHYRLRRMNHPVSWYTATCLPHEREVPLSGVESMLRTILGIDDADPEVVVRERALRTRELGLSEEEQRVVAVVLGAGGRLDAGGASLQLLRSASMKMASRLAQDQLTVLFWDGAENMDDESQSLVDELMRSATRARIVVVVACRPGFIYAWRTGENLEEIALGPLPDDEVRTLVAQRLGVDSESNLPRDLLEDLTTKGSGNPMFIEEYLRSLKDSGGLEIRDGVVVYHRHIAEVGVPKTLRGLVASEIARMSASQRSVLQYASVIGTRFQQDLLADVGGFAMAALEGALTALVERGSVVHAGAGEYAFAHELRREVVYESLPLDARRQMHATVAAAIERQFGDRLDEYAERLAHHHREANERTKAVDYQIRAAERQEAECAYASAAHNFARALEMVLASPRADTEQVMQLYARIGKAAVHGREMGFGLEKIRLGLAYAEELGNRAWVVKMLVLSGRLLTLANRIVEAVAHFERARELIDPEAERETLGEIVTAIGETLTRNGEFRRAHQYLEEAAVIAGQRGDRRDAATALLSLCRCEAAAGEPARALATWGRARDLVAGLDGAVLQVELEKGVAMVQFLSRDFVDAAVHFERAFELAREFGLPYEICVNAHNMGDALLRLGDYKRAFTAVMTSLNVAQEYGFEKMTHLNTVFLAFIDAARFGSEDGRARVEAALRYAETDGQTWDVLQVKYLLGVVAKEQGDRDRARQLLREAMALANETDNRLYIEDCEILLRELTSVAPASVEPR